MQLYNPIKVNHVGYLPHAKKVFRISDPQSESFAVDLFKDEMFTPVYEGTLQKCAGEDFGQGFMGDFSELVEEGIYRVQCGDQNSRCFIVYQEVYDTTIRILQNYLLWQRCGDAKGWKGFCHIDDEIRMPDGERWDLKGGYHQSSDLRKWTYGLSLSLFAFSKFVQRYDAHWDEGEIEKELRHGCDYLQRVTTDDGMMIDSSFLPEGWGKGETAERKIVGGYDLLWKKREFYLYASPAPAHWDNIRFQITAAGYFKVRDPEMYRACLDCANRIWRYMNRQDRDYTMYKPFKCPPFGHDGYHIYFEGYYQDSALDLAGKAFAAISIYKETNEAEYLTQAEECVNRLCDLQVGGNPKENLAAGCFTESANSEVLANNYIYFYNTYIPLVLCEMIELQPNGEDTAQWKATLKNIVTQYCCACDHNAFGRVPATWYIEGNDKFSVETCFSFSNTEEEDLTEGFEGGSIEASDKKVFYKYNSFCSNLDIIASGLVLLKASKILDDEKYLKYTQFQIDWILGVNPSDASSIEAVGYNQPHRGVFGEFFPPIPQIPGAVFTGITTKSFNPKGYGLDCEYDMPMNTWMLYLLAEYHNIMRGE